MPLNQYCQSTEGHHLPMYQATHDSVYTKYFIAITTWSVLMISPLKTAYAI